MLCYWVLSLYFYVVNAADDGDNDVSNTSAMDVDVEDLTMLDDLEHHFILQRGNEIPFTYLASLSAKFSANDGETSVRGKIKVWPLNELCIYSTSFSSSKQQGFWNSAL